MSSCSECQWWGKHLVGANFSPNNKKRALCEDPDSDSNYKFYVHQSRVKGSFPKGGWDYIVDFWTYEDFSCKNFKLKPVKVEKIKEGVADKKKLTKIT